LLQPGTKVQHKEDILQPMGTVIDDTPSGLRVLWSDGEETVEDPGDLEDIGHLLLGWDTSLPGGS
jgi:hypothetical protein